MIALWKLATSRLGLTVLGVLVALALVWGWGASRYQAGFTAGAAKVQATIDKPVTGWADRLEACGTDLAELRRETQARNEAIERQAAAAAEALASAQAAVDAAAKREKRDAATIAALSQPLTGSDSCARLMEVDRRLLESLR